MEGIGWRLVALAAALVVAGCSSDSGQAASSSSSTATSAPTTTAPVPPETTTTTPPVSTTSTPLAPSTSVTAPSTPSGPPAPAGALLTMLNDNGSSILLTRHDAADGSLVEHVEVGLELGVYFVYDPSTTDDITLVNSNSEDFWFTCAGYNGIVRQVATDGSAPELLEGGLAHLTDDGSHLAYTRASTCGPDAVDPANWVHAPRDTIVWRDLATGQEQAWTFPGAVLDSEERPPVTALTLSGDQIVAIVSDRLVVFTAAEGSPDVEGSPPVELPQGELIRLLGGRPDGTVVALRSATSQSGARLVELDPTTGTDTEITNYPNHTLAALSRSGADLAVFTDGVLTVNGNEVVLEGVDPGTITSIAW